MTMDMDFDYSAGRVGSAWLAAEQRYVFSRSRLGISYHTYDDSLVRDGYVSGHDKAAVMGWDLSRIVCALYLEDGGSFVGLVAPMSVGKIDQRSVLPSVIGGMSRSSAKRYSTKDFFPTGMERGTCTPLVYECDVASPVRYILFHDEPSLDEQVVDISVGGKGTLAQRTSAQLKYGDLYSILLGRFGDTVVRRVDMRMGTV